MTDARPPAGDLAPETMPRLTRSRRHKVVSGVCGGLGRHFDLDPVIFRVPLAVLSAIGGLGLVFYGFAWLIVPLEGEDENEGRRLLSGRVEGAALSAVLCALVGCGLFLASVGRGSGATESFSLMLAVAVGGAAYWSRHRRGLVRAAAVETEGGAADPATAHTVADAPPETQAPPVPAGPSWWRGPLPGDGGREAGPGARDTGYLWGPEEGSYGKGRNAGGSVGDRAWDGAGGSISDSAWDGAAENAWKKGPPGGREQSPVPGPRRRRSIGGPVFLLAVAAAAVGTAAAWSAQPLGLALAVGFGCALGVFALGALTTVFHGRLGGGTLFAVLCTAALLTGSLLLPRNITTAWADTTWRPASAAAVERSYTLGTGRGTLDLTGVELEPGRTLRTEVDLGAGQVRIVVPDDVGIELAVDIGGGGYRLPDRFGTDVSSAAGESGAVYGGVGVSDRLTLAPAGGGEADGTLELRVRVGLGEAVIVERPAAEPADGQS